MAVSRVYSHTELIWDGPGWRRKRQRAYLPSRERYYYFTRGPYTLLLRWKPWDGIRLVAEMDGGPSGRQRKIYPLRGPEMPVRRRPNQTPGKTIAPEAKQTSVLLAKLPALREWLVATIYDDGSERVPGKLSLEVYGTSWCVTLRDPNTGLKLPIRGEDLDKTLLLAEQLLGVEEAPWERDKWLTEQLVKGSKKK